MRQTVYKCDQCKGEIGEKTHISLSFGNYSGIAIKPPTEYWEVTEALNERFLHFCDEKHMAAYFKALLKKGTEALKLYAAKPF